MGRVVGGTPTRCFIGDDLFLGNISFHHEFEPEAPVANHFAPGDADIRGCLSVRFFQLLLITWSLHVGSLAR